MTHIEPEHLGNVVDSVATNNDNGERIVSTEKLKEAVKNYVSSFGSISTQKEVRSQNPLKLAKLYIANVNADTSTTHFVYIN